jgi:hypothetical protein
MADLVPVIAKDANQDVSRLAQLKRYLIAAMYTDNVEAASLSTKNSWNMKLRVTATGNEYILGRLSQSAGGDCKWGSTPSSEVYRSHLFQPVRYVRWVEGSTHWATSHCESYSS